MRDTPSPPSALVCRVSVVADRQVIQPVRDFLKSMAKFAGLPDDDLSRLDLLVEEGCRYVIESAFDPHETGSFQIALGREPNRLVLVLEDAGLPIQYQDATPLDRSQLALLPMRALADEVKFHYLGKSGKRFEFYYDLPADPIDRISGNESAVGGDLKPPVRASDEVVLRMMEPDDAIEVSRCVYRSYGYSYAYEFIYYPARIVEMLKSEQMRSCIAINESGRVVAHLAMLFNTPSHKVCESAIAVVEPPYRGRKLFEEMKAFTRAQAEAMGLYGLFSKAVTIHPYSQRSNLAMGAHETGFLLGHSVANQVFRNITAETASHRQTTALFHLRAAKEPRRVVYPPPRHVGMIKTIYDKGEVDRVLELAPESIFDSVRGRRTTFDVTIKEEVGQAYLSIGDYGSDVMLAVHTNLRELTPKESVECIYLDLPLCHPLTALLCKVLESFGLFFGGVLIEFQDGDLLRLQYLNNVAIDPNDIKTVSAYGRELLDYILMQREMAEGNKH